MVEELWKLELHNEKVGMEIENKLSIVGCVGMVSEMCTVTTGNVCKKPLVSVGILTYNRPNGLRRTLECITGQTYKNLEIVVSNNCSPESETDDVVREFMARDSRIQYYRQEMNKGPVFNFKFVLEKASGEYFMWAADDDTWEPEFVSRLAHLLDCNAQISVAMTGGKQFYDDGVVIERMHVQDLVRPGYNQFKLAVSAAAHNIVAWELINYYWYGLYRAEVLRRFACNLDNSFQKDQLIICELLLSERVGYVDELLYAKHMYPKAFSERYPGEEQGKSYGDRLGHLKQSIRFGPYLLRSPNVPWEHKLWIPFLAIRQGIGTYMIFKTLMVRKLCIIARKNSILWSLLIKLRNLVKGKVST